MPEGPAPSMPRKARDVLASANNDGDAGSSSIKRSSIDALISEDKRSDAKDSDDDDLGTDFIKVSVTISMSVTEIIRPVF